MTPILAWTRRWNLPQQAVAELMQVLGTAVSVQPPVPTTATSEAATQAHRMLRAARRGAWLIRNNSGALTDKTGRLVRYGLGHSDANTIKVCKSSDLIGIEPVLVTQQHVGTIIGRFVAEEIKHPGWVYLGDRPCICKPRKPLCDYCHQRAQMNFIKKIISLGGRASFVTDPEAP